ncbi:hypothetical protein [Ornithinibacillus scapharcae]|uniref:hypothetical protein n=1 Tax=Ornithinibacillus scapharcae TaxID=1147159 RepID=UPI000225B259|nr:hypothetical protein [Ornithinibacillus scapharcae]
MIELEKETTLFVINYEDLLKATLISKQTNDINSLHDIWSIHSYQGKKRLYIAPKMQPKELEDKHELGGYLFYRIPDGTNMKVVLGKTEKGWEIVNMEKEKVI